MKLYRTAVVVTVAVAITAGAIALVAAACSSDEAGTFADGFDATVTHTLRGPVLSRYLGEGGPAGPLGLPLSEENPTTFEPMTARGADTEVGFRHGAIYMDSHTGETWFGVWKPYVPPRQ